MRHPTPALMIADGIGESTRAACSKRDGNVKDPRPRTTTVDVGALPRSIDDFDQMLAGFAFRNTEVAHAAHVVGILQGRSADRVPVKLESLGEGGRLFVEWRGFTFTIKNGRLDTGIEAMCERGEPLHLFVAQADQRLKERGLKRL